MQVPACQLEPGLERIVACRRHRPDGRLPRPRPPDQNRARRRRVPERVRVVQPERVSCFAVRHLRAAEQGVQAGREVAPPCGEPSGRPGTCRVRTPPGRARRSRRPGTAAPTAGRASFPPSLMAPLPRRAHGSTTARPAACCPAAPPRQPAAANPVPAKAARPAHPPGVGRPGSAACSARAATSMSLV